MLVWFMYNFVWRKFSKAIKKGKRHIYGIQMKYIPEIFFKDWFWLTIIAVIIAINYFLTKRSPAPRANTPAVKFFKRQHTKLSVITDIFISLIIITNVVLIFKFGVFNSIDTDHSENRAVNWVIFLIPTASFSANIAFFTGLLTIFHKNLTKVKRTMLLLLCLFPLTIGIICYLITPENSENLPHSVAYIELSIIVSASAWLINAPAIFTGTHFIYAAWEVLKKLKIVPEI